SVSRSRWTCRRTVRSRRISPAGSSRPGRKAASSSGCASEAPAARSPHGDCDDATAHGTAPSRVGVHDESVPAGCLLLCVLILALSALYLLTGIRENLIVAGPGSTNRIGNGIGTDFPAFSAAAVEARAGRASAVYDMDALTAAHRAVRGVDVQPYAWAYPP